MPPPPPKTFFDGIIDAFTPISNKAEAYGSGSDSESREPYEDYEYGEDSEDEDTSSSVQLFACGRVDKVTRVHSEGPIEYEEVESYNGGMDVRGTEIVDFASVHTEDFKEDNTSLSSKYSW